MTALEGSPKRYRIELTSGAYRDIQAIKQYIEDALHAANAARRTVERILSTAEALSTLPLRNRVLATTVTEHKIRAARSGNYTLLYLVSEDTVQIIAVLYSARDIEKRLEGLLNHS